MNKHVQNVLRRHAEKISKEKFLMLCGQVKEVLDKILDEKYEFETIKDARSALESPEDLIVPWDQIDEEAQEDTIDLLKGAKGDAFRFYDSGLNDLLETYENYANLEQFLAPIFDREYTDLYTLSEWGA